MKVKTIIMFIMLLLPLTASICEAGNHGEWPDLKTNSGGDGPYNRGGYSPKGMDGVIRGDGVYMSPAPGRDTYYGSDIYDEERQGDPDAKELWEEGNERDDLDSNQ